MNAEMVYQEIQERKLGEFMKGSAERKGGIPSGAEKKKSYGCA